MKQISAILDILWYKAPELISYSYVLLDGDKMSTSNGTVVLVTDFMKAVKETLIKEIEKYLKKNYKYCVTHVLNLQC